MLLLLSIKRSEMDDDFAQHAWRCGAEADLSTRDTGPLFIGVQQYAEQTESYRAEFTTNRLLAILPKLRVSQSTLGSAIFTTLIH